MGGRGGGGGRAGRGGGGAGGAAGGAGGMPTQEVIKELGLTSADLDSIKTTNSILGAGIKEYSNAEEVSRTAADIINSGTRTGYTVYGSPLTTISVDKAGNLASHRFAAVDVGSQGAMNRGARMLEDQGFKVKKIDNSLFKGLVVST